MGLRIRYERPTSFLKSEEIESRLEVILSGFVASRGLFGTEELEEFHGVERETVDADREVEMRPERVASIATLRHTVAFLYMLPQCDQGPGKMHVERHQAEAMIDDDGVAVVSKAPGKNDSASIHRVDGSAESRAKVRAIVAQVDRARLPTVAIGIRHKRGAIEGVAKFSAPEFLPASGPGDSVQGGGVF